MILVTYASKYGSTAEVARVVADTLAANGVKTTCLPVNEVDNLAGYAAVILGSPIYSAEWLPEALEFVARYRAQLSAMPVALFAVCLRMRDDSAATRESVQGVLERVRIEVQPVSIGLFAGALDYSKLSPIVRLQVETKNLPEGDFRDWNAIKSWAGELQALKRT